MLHTCKFSQNPPTGSWDIVQTRKSHANADANADANRIHTKNNMSPSPSVGDIIPNVTSLQTWLKSANQFMRYGAQKNILA